MIALRFSKRIFSLLVLTALVLTGCETMNDFGNRFADFRFPTLWSTSASPEETASLCPDAEVVQELRNLSEFAPMAPTQPDQLVSSVRIANLKTICRSIDSTSVTLDLAVTLTGSLGPKARIKPSDKPSFAYPYFVALTTEDGKIAAKEIHAISLSYDKGQNTITREDTLSHTLPMRLSATPGSRYRLLIGFQLANDQLAYNRAHPEPKINTDEIVAMVTAGEKTSPAKTPETLAAIAPAAGDVPRTTTKPPRRGIKPVHTDLSARKDSANPLDVFP